MAITEGEKKRQKELNKRVRMQEERILEQRKIELNRVFKARERTKRLPITEEQKREEEEQLTTRSGKILAKSSKWNGVWSRRQAKWDTRKRKVR